jgi:superfamily I DNA and/or RNA helicase
MVASLIWCLRQCASKELDGRLQAAHAAPSATEFWSTIVGIVTPHRAQRAAVIRELRRLFPNDSPLEIAKAVDTVEKFQGDERHVIIVSFAVGDPDVIAGEEAFLMQLERTNVAISRAMAKCIVTMPSSLAGHIPEDRKALETAHALKGYVDEFCNRSVAITITGANVTRNGQLRWRA